jgi:hypothetical protein
MVSHLEFVEDVRDVIAGGFIADMQLLSDLTGCNVQADLNG